MIFLGGIQPTALKYISVWLNKAAIRKCSSYCPLSYLFSSVFYLFGASLLMQVMNKSMQKSVFKSLPLYRTRWMNLGFLCVQCNSNSPTFAVLCIEIVLKSELWTPFLCLSPLFRGWRWIFLFRVWIQRLCCLQAQQVKSITSRVIFPAAVSKNLHQWLKSSRSNTLVSCFAE